MSEEDDAAVVASALSFLDEFYALSTPDGAATDSRDAGVDVATGMASPGSLQAAGERARSDKRRDTNRARATARRELLSLRTQVSSLESELALIIAQRRCTRGVKTARPDASDGAILAWKDVAASQLNQRLRSIGENHRLRALVSEKRRVLLELRRSLLSRVVNEAKQEFCVSASELRLPAFNLEVARVMQELSHRVDTAYSDVGSLFDQSNSRPVSTSAASPYIATEAPRKLVARHFLPFNSSSTGVATWHHLSRVIRPHAMSLFSYRDESDHASTTVTEYFGMNLTLGASSAEFRVIQTLRRYVRPGREVIIYESVLDPLTFNGESVQARSFHEQGAIRITPQQQTREQKAQSSCVEVCYSLAPPDVAAIQGDEAAPERREVDALTKFVLQSMMAVTTINFHKIENILFDDAVQRTKTQPSATGK